MMERIVLVFMFVLTGYISHAQENRFSATLDKYCKEVIREFRTIPAERKTTLDEMANQLVNKKYVVFTCHTNSRRTVLLQVWFQTAFYYYGVFDKYAFSIGDTVTNIYSGVANVLTTSGFNSQRLSNDSTVGYAISINDDYPISILTSKNEVGTIDTTKGLIVNICYGEEPMGTASNSSQIDLPYKSPSKYERTRLEKQKYTALNRQIATEMLFLARRMKEIMPIHLIPEKY